MDPRFPAPLMDELAINIFVDADHAHDKVSGRSITGLLATVGSTPVTWKSKRQTSVQTSTFGAEFTALKLAVEEAITIRYHLRSMGSGRQHVSHTQCNQPWKRTEQKSNCPIVPFRPRTPSTKSHLSSQGRYKRQLRGPLHESSFQCR
eukprot:scaffold9600_cov79-Cylindrotheca_fusiformis.AAC.1